MTYIFLARFLSTYTGGPIYVRNKLRYLKANGWKVEVFASPDIYGQPIVIEELKVYENSLFKELFFHPSYFSRNELKRIISVLISRIPKDDKYVVESNQLILGEWGELIAEKLHAQHIVFNINEKNIINDENVYGFINWKLERNEFFAISAKACANLFSKYREIPDPENHFWRSAATNDLGDMLLSELNDLTQDDYVIGYFGRYKSFLPYVFSQINSFAMLHQNKSIVLVLLGVTEIREDDYRLMPARNLQIKCIGPKSPVPKVFFKKVDVVIATAGCAAISYESGARTISMSVESDAPLGILGYTTNALSYAKGFVTDERELLQLLDAVLIDGDLIKKVDTSFLDVKAEDKYKQQIAALSYKPGYYDVLTIPLHLSFSQHITKIFVKIGFGKMFFDIKCLFVNKCG